MVVGEGHVHGENGGTAADIEDDLVLEDVLILHDGVHVRARTNLIFLYEAMPCQIPVCDKSMPLGIVGLQVHGGGGSKTYQHLLVNACITTQKGRTLDRQTLVMLAHWVLTMVVVAIGQICQRWSSGDTGLSRRKLTS
jgi:hypothetical protein